jgi:hypothetical protein
MEDWRERAHESMKKLLSLVKMLDAIVAELKE